MPRKTFTLLVLIFILIGTAMVGGYLYFFTGVFGERERNEATKILDDFLPFGQQPLETGRSPGGQPSEPAESPLFSSKLLKLVQNPVAGFTPTTLGSSTVVRYMEKETGHIFDIDMSIPAAKSRITNTTIPRVYQSLFGQNGQSVILRYLNDDSLVETYYAKIPLASSTEDFRNGVEIKGSFLSKSINDLSLSPSGTKIFTLIKFGKSAIGTVSSPDGTKKSQIFDSPFTEWLSSWANDKIIMLVTKPSYAAPGYIYTLDSASGNFQKIYGGTKGLTAILSPDEKKILISESGDGLPQIKIYDISSGRLSALGLRTIADKCNWVTSAKIYCAVPDENPESSTKYPDLWYQGVVSFKDSLWEIDPETLSTYQILPISQVAREDLDAINLFQNKSGEYLFFVNKKDSSLWSIKLER